jgi:GT2 family glycosyltransferase
MQAPRFLLVATVDAHEARRNDLARLLRSLDGQGVEIDLHLVVRGEPSGDGVSANRLVPSWLGDMVLHDAPAGIGLSAARNIALRRAAASGRLARADAVAFPDDDCWYPPRLFARVAEHLNSWDVVMGSYSAHPPERDPVRFPPGSRELDWRTAYERAASVTQFYRAAAVVDVGLFDERFGLGASYRSAEDADYLVRAVDAGWRCRYEPGLVVGHRRPEGAYERSYLGGTTLLAKHAMQVGVARRLLARRLIIGACRTATGALEPATYLSTLRAVAITLGRIA